MPKTLIRASLALAVLSALALGACSRKEASTPPAEQTAPPPKAEASSPGSIRIGELTGIALRDGGLEFPNDNKIIGIGKSPEDVAAVLTAAGLPSDKLSLTIAPLLVKANDRTLLFDTGAGTNFGPNAGGLAKSLAEAGIQAQNITDIFISHAHGDHVGGLIDAEGALAFPNATIHMSAAEWTFLKDMTAEMAANTGNPRHTKMIAAITPKVSTFEPGAELIPGVVKAVPITGHTPGHSGYLIGTGESSLLFIGDTMHHYVVSVQRPDWTIAFDGDAPTAQKSRADLIAQSAANKQRIYAVHFPYPGVGTFERRGEEYVWKPE
jgi:glyoxylase-like metal-dependent hydrolase (beta-lactamase superfamily II)/predicted small lipoprotein YifL